MVNEAITDKPGIPKRILRGVHNIVTERWEKGIKEVNNRCIWLEKKFCKHLEPSTTESEQEWVNRM